MKKVEKSLLVMIIILAVILVVYFGEKKVNYHCDEIWTYGLSNNIGGINPKFEIGKTYTGMGPFESFIKVLDGEEFNYANVWENQAKDVHPPFYYILIHTICSVFKGTFSKWYGIGLNIFWMTLILSFLYLLSKKITKSILASFGVVIAYATSVVFLDTMLLIRMYAQFTFFVVLLMYLFKQNWDKKPEKQFMIKLGITLFFGMLTHYYFLFIAFFMCLIYGIKLIIIKDKLSVRNYIISLGIAGLTYGVVWYHILAHIFNGYRGEEAISKAISFGGLLSGFVGMATILNNEAFAGIIIVFIAIGIIFSIVKLKEKSFGFDFTLCMFLCALFYMLIVGKICPAITTRYIMPISWIFILCAYISVRYIIQLLIKSNLSEYVVIVLFCVVSFVSLLMKGFIIPMNYNNANQQNAIRMASGKNAVVYVDLNWKILYDFVLLQNADRYKFVDEDCVEQELSSQSEDFIFIVNLEEGREDVVSKFDAELLYDDGMSYYYLIKNSVKK